MSWLSDAIHDAKYSFRGLGRNPAFSIVVILVLALAVGTNAAIFSAADAMLFETPPHVVDPERVLLIRRNSIYHGDYARLEQAAESVSLAGYGGKTDWTFGGGMDSRLIQGQIVTHEYFPVLGVQPILGRWFVADEDYLPAMSGVVILGYSFWERQFASDRNVLGQTIYLSNRPFTIIGVAPEGFTGIDFAPVDVWLPAGAQPQPTANWVSLVGRLEANATIDQARDEMQVRFPPRSMFVVDLDGSGSIVQVRPLRQTLAARIAELNLVLLCLVGAGAALLLIACANVASLLVNRAFQRRYEIAVRLQLGANRGRIIRQLLTESVVLTALSSGLSFLFVYWTTPILRSLMSLPTLQQAGFVNFRVLVALAVIAFASAIVSSIIPTIYVGKADAGQWLKVRVGVDRQGVAIRNGLLVTQVVFTAVLMVSAGLFLRSLNGALNLNYGLSMENVFVATVDFQRAGFESSDILANYGVMVESMRQNPNVVSASLTSSIPTQGGGFRTWSVPGRSSEELPYGGLTRVGPRSPQFSAVSPDYFATVGIRLLSGREFLPSDNTGAPLVVIVDQLMGRDLWPGETPIGKCIAVGSNPACREIVGVVSSIRTSVERLSRIGGTFERDFDPMYYVPIAQFPDLMPRPVEGLLIRVRDMDAALQTIQPQLQGSVPNLPHVKIDRLSVYLERQTATWRTGATLFSAFGGLALFVAAVGIYSILAFVMKQRTHEMGVRLAIGARPGDIVRLALRIGMLPVLIAISIGTVTALAITQFLKTLLFGVTPMDPLSLLAVAGIIAIVALIACLIPAVRAARIDPLVSLRHE